MVRRGYNYEIIIFGFRFQSRTHQPQCDGIIDHRHEQRTRCVRTMMQETHKRQHEKKSLIRTAMFLFLQSGAVIVSLAFTEHTVRRLMTKSKQIDRNAAQFAFHFCILLVFFWLNEIRAVSSFHSSSFCFGLPFDSYGNYRHERLLYVRH